MMIVKKGEGVHVKQVRVSVTLATLSILGEYIFADVIIKTYSSTFLFGS